MIGRAFLYYFPVLDRYLRCYRAGEGPGDPDDSYAAIIAGGICTQLLSPTKEELRDVLDAIRSLAVFVRAHSSQLVLDPAEQAAIDSHWQILPSQMDS